MEATLLAVTFLFTLALLHHIPSAFGSYNISESLIQVRPYDYSDFVLQWQISACMTARTCVAGRATQSFGIHGLWPMRSRNGGELVTDCRNRPAFDGTKIKGTLRQSLVRLWPSLYDNRNEDFWRYQWDKHGSCLEDGGDSSGAVVNYFTTAVNAANRYPLWNYLTAADIETDVPYDVSTITNAITSRLSIPTTVTNPVQVQCVRLRGRLVVTQIFLCLNKRGTALANCPTRTLCSPQSQPMFPSTTAPAPPPPSRPPPPRRPSSPRAISVSKLSSSERSVSSSTGRHGLTMSSESGAPTTPDKGENAGIESSVPLLAEI